MRDSPPQPRWRTRLPPVMLFHQSQLKFMDWQWKLQEEMEKMVALIRQPRIEEKDTLAQLEKILAIEREVKREQVTLLVRIKNKLTPDQQTRLVKLRSGS